MIIFIRSYVCNLINYIRNYVWFCHFYFSLLRHKLSSRIYQNVMTKHVLLLHDLDLGPTSRSTLMPKIKVIGSKRRARTGRQTHANKLMLLNALSPSFAVGNYEYYEEMPHSTWHLCLRMPGFLVKWLIHSSFMPCICGVCWHVLHDRFNFSSLHASVRFKWRYLP